MSEINLKPLADRVVVRPLTDEEAGKPKNLGWPPPVVDGAIY